MAGPCPLSLSLNQAITSPNDEHSLTCTLRVPDLDFMHTDPVWKSTEELVPRLPADRVPFPIQRLEVKLGSRLGNGSTGLVYEVFPTNYDADLLPPMVIKVARYHRQANLAAEAWFYEELAALQGVTIPRCYGWFEAELPDECQPWYFEDIAKEEPPSPPTSAVLMQQYPSWGSKLLNYTTSVTRVSLLLMEKLGNELPFGEELPASLEPELLALLHEIALCGTTIDDIRYYNFRASLATPLHLNLPSPLTQRTYNWRVYDLESCAKVNNELEWRDYDHRNLLIRMLGALPKGFIVEPWVF